MRQLVPGYAVAPQITPEDMEAIAAAGVTTVIDNRPDMEIPPPLHAAEMRRAAEALGLTFVEIPADSRSMTGDVVEAHRQAVANSPGPVLAYCASGTRSTILWALSQAGTRTADEIIAAAADGGYDIEMVRPALEAAEQEG